MAETSPEFKNETNHSSTIITLKSKALRHGRSLSLPSTSDSATSQIEENFSKLKFSEASSLSLRSKAVHHGRSLSLPSTSNSFTSQIDENLSRVNASLATSPCLSSFSDKISGITNLYHNLDEFLSLPHIQQTLAQQPQQKWIDQVLDGHVRLLDACNTVKDIFSLIRQSVQDLLSAHRRKDVTGIQCYLVSRKTIRKMINKSMKDLKSLRSKRAQSVDGEIVCLFDEAESSTFIILEILLTHAMQTKVNKSLVSKLIKSKKISHQGEDNEFIKIEALLHMTQGDDTQGNKFVHHLREMESNIQFLEEELEGLFRQFIKIRVSLLNRINY